jgi:hypothetical protein
LRYIAGVRIHIRVQKRGKLTFFYSKVENQALALVTFNECRGWAGRDASEPWSAKYAYKYCYWYKRREKNPS